MCTRRWHIKLSSWLPCPGALQVVTLFHNTKQLTLFSCAVLQTLVALKLAAPCLMRGPLANEEGAWLFISYTYGVQLDFKE
jgi:hypothetical protein